MCLGMLKNWGYRAPYNHNFHRLCHAKCPFNKSNIGRKLLFVFLVKFSFGIWGIDRYIMPNYSAKSQVLGCHTNFYANDWFTIMIVPNLTCCFLKGVLHPNQKLTCFVLYLKIINIFLKNNICILKFKE